MEWLDVKTNKLPDNYEKVLVWIKYDGQPEFEYTDSWLDDQENINGFNYKEPITGKYWAMGSARNYVITHFMRVKPPKR